MSQRSLNTISQNKTPRHGHVFSPASRAYFAWLKGLLDEGALNQRESGKFFPQTAGGLPDPFAKDDVANSEPPRDGEIASAGQLTGKVLDAPGDHWEKHPVRSGESLTVSWDFSAAHRARRWNYFLTKKGWDSSSVLTRDQFEAEPIHTEQFSWQPYWSYPDELKPTSPTVHDVPLPERDGYHVLLCVYEVADTSKAFYQVVDLNFVDNGGGERPGTPTGLAASDITDKQVKLTWNQATGPYPIAFYRMTRNGTTTVDIEAPLLEWTDRSVAAHTPYDYSICAVDDRGNFSMPSRAIRVRTLAEDGAPTAPVNLHSMGQTATSISLMWGASTGGAPIVNYLIFRDGQEVKSVSGSQTSVDDTGLTSDTTYQYWVKALDLNGKLSSSSNALAVKTLSGDGQYPAWKLNTQYAKEARVSHAGQNWRCIQAHTSYVPDWAPDEGDNVLWVKQP